MRQTLTYLQVFAAIAVPVELSHDVLLHAIVIRRAKRGREGMRDYAGSIMQAV